MSDINEQQRSGSSQDNHPPDACYATSTLLQRLIDRINRAAPINLEFVTLPLGHASVRRIQSLETLYASSSVFRFLVRKGVNPVVLFVSTSAALAVAMNKFYKQSNHLALTVVGVGYPLWRCWQLVKEHTGEADSSERLEEHKAWLTYWILYGSLQVLDNWAEDLRQLVPRYNLYKLLILYWAQNPHSNGASLLHRHVIQKPVYDDTYPEYYDPISHHHATTATTTPAPRRFLSFASSLPSYAHSSAASSVAASSDSSSESEHNQEPLTFTLEHHTSDLHSNEVPSTGARSHLMLDGYTPPPLHRDSTVHARPKQEFPMMTAMETESSAW